MRRPTRWAAVVAGIVLASSACSAGVEIIPQAERPADIYGEAGPARERSVRLYFVQGNRLVAVSRTGRAAGSPAEVSMRALLAGPRSEELAEHIRTEVPSETELLGVVVDGGVAEVNLSSEFWLAVGLRNVQTYYLRIAQVVWTLDELTDVDAIQFLKDGQPQPVLDQRGNTIERPVARGRYSNYEPRSDRPVSEAPIGIDI